MQAPAPPVGRLAPSPTGRLHVGHARSFLIAWWSMRARGGRLLLRIDDIDHTRVKPGMVEACLRDLEWLGLDWDEPPYYQSQQKDRHQAALDALLTAEQAYPCVCTRREIEQALSAPHLGDEESVYPGTCRDRYPSLAQAELQTGRRAGLRLRVPSQAIHWQDAFLGEQHSPVANQVGDFLIARRDQVFAYQLACAVDDAAQGITEVLRGDDLASSAPRQQLIQGLLGLDSPGWTHIPLVHGEDGERLAKRNQSISLASLRESGMDPRQLVAWVAESCGMGRHGQLTARELVGAFDLQQLPRTPASFSMQELKRS